MDKLIQTSEGCAQRSESQERSFTHTHTRAPSFSVAWTSFANNKDMAMCHFSTSRCCFEKKACVVSSVAGGDGWMKNGNVALRFVGSEVIG